MPYTKIMIHLVWATKKHDPSIRKEIRTTLINHIKAKAVNKGIFIIMINCHYDHVRANALKFLTFGLALLLEFLMEMGVRETPINRA